MHVRRFEIPVETSAPGGTTNAYLLGEENALLVDPAARTDELDAAVDRYEVARIAVTHTHPDHVGAVARYADETGATLWGRRWREDYFRGMTGRDPDRTFVEGTTLPAGDSEVTVLDTPGHARDHVAFDGAPGIVCGDLAMAEGSVVVGSPEGDMLGYLAALRRVLARDPDRLFPGHGPVIESPRETVERLIRHRRDREKRVLAAVESGARTPDEVLDRAYDKDLSGVRELARATVVAHLEKLDAEGRVAWRPATERVEPR